jgi:hypothetical protein
MMFQIRQLGTADYPLVISVIDQWWGGRQMADKPPGSCSTTMTSPS